MNLQIKTIYYLLIIFFFSCGISSEKETDIIYYSEYYSFPYTINNHNHTQKLPKTLKEISGLSFISDNLLAAIQDEKGYVYIYDLDKKIIADKIFFLKKGDFEGIEIVNNDVWVVKSNGTLYEIKNYLTDSLKTVRRYDTKLSKSNNVEGLAFDKTNNSLLLACKGKPGIGNKKSIEKNNLKTIYKFDLTTKSLDPTPVLNIFINEIKKFIPTEKDFKFSPSAIAIHPKTGNKYILSSVGKYLLVFSDVNILLSAIKLNPKYHYQPEGICFSPNGTLYISNEGKNKSAIISKYKYKK